jgi:hypothetical protein
MTPSDEQRTQIRQFADSLAELRESMEAGSPSRLFAEFSQQGGAATLAANEHGLVYFASILMALAAEASPGQHFHFDENTVLSRCNSKLILQFLDGPYEAEWAVVPR